MLANSIEHYRGYEIAVRRREETGAWQATVTRSYGVTIGTGHFAVYGDALAEAKLIVDHRLAVTRPRV
jgi:hypothetical protein